MQTQENSALREQAVADGVLAQQALGGDAQAFEVLVHRYSTSLFNFIYHMLGDHDLACDILQQVFLQLYLSLSTLRTGEPLKPWLFQVARNRCLDDIRQHTRWQSAPRGISRTTRHPGVLTSGDCRTTAEVSRCRFFTLHCSTQLCGDWADSPYAHSNRQNVFSACQASSL